jgi:DNA-binding response OmpR family regulator
VGERKAILLIERQSRQMRTFAAELEHKGYAVSIVSNGRAALQEAAKHPPDIVVLNAASLGTSGLRICRDLRESLRAIPLIHILPEGATQDQKRQSPSNASLIMPFTIRKLVNRIERLLPGERAETIEAGPVRLTLGVRVVACGGKERRLTPKAADLLEVLLRHPNEVLDRRFLMREVWDTDYLGDTRTLDVHIRWLREAVEDRSGRPRYIVTVRGVGYRFDPNPDEND